MQETFNNNVHNIVSDNKTNKEIYHFNQLSKAKQSNLITLVLPHYKGTLFNTIRKSENAEPPIFNNLQQSKME